MVLVAAAGLPWLESPIGRRFPSSAPVLALALGSGVVALSVLGRFGPAPARSALAAHRVMAVAAAICVTIVAWTVLHLAFADPALWVLVDDNEQYGEIVSFSRAHLIANLGFDPTYQAVLTTEGVHGRLAAAYYFMGAGWWLALVSGLVFAGAALATGRWSALRWGASTGGLAALTASLVLSPALVALFREARGDRQLAFGRYPEAVAQYGAAQALSAQARHSERIWLRIGEAYVQLGMAAHPASQFYLAERDLRLGHLEASLGRFRLLYGAAPPEIGEAVRKRASSALALSGLNAYRAGRVAAATPRWEESLAIEPAQTRAAFYLSRAYYDLGRYEASIGMSQDVLSRTRNKILRADAMANIGDSHTRLGQYTLARQAYQASRRLDPVANFRILRSLGGT